CVCVIAVNVPHMVLLVSVAHSNHSMDQGNKTAPLRLDTAVSLSLSPSIHLFFSISPSLSLSPSLHLFRSLSLSLCLSLSLSLFLSLSLSVLSLWVPNRK